MKVYQINSTARFSTGTLAMEIQKELLCRGHEARLAYGNLGSTDKSLYHISQTLTQRLDAKFEQLTGVEGIFTRKNTRDLIRDIEKFEPDIIHLHNIHGNYLKHNALFRYLQERQYPVVVTLHDCWLLTGGCYHFTAEGCYKWRETCQACSYLPASVLKKVCTSAQKRLAEKKSWFKGLNHVTVVAVSQWLCEVARQSHLGSRGLCTIYNGIDTQQYAPKDVSELRKKYHCEEKTVLLGVASSWNARKGLNEWIDLAQYLGVPFQIVLVGLQENQLPSNAPDNVIAINRTQSAEELASYYNLADIFINMSFEETFGLTTAEAMACGKPVIVLNSTANPELVTEDTGKIIADRSPETVAAAVSEIIDQGTEMYQKACVDRARKCFGKERMVEQYLQVYQKIGERQ